MKRLTIGYLCRKIGIVLVIAFGLTAASAVQPAFDTVAFAQEKGAVPGKALGNQNDSEFWRKIRSGAPGLVSIPDPQAAVMINSSGSGFRAFRNGPLSAWGGWGLLVTIIAISAFFAWRGKIRIESGPSGKTIERFNLLERTAHWIAAISFVVLALTGLVTLYGRYALKPVMGADGFAALAAGSKFIHNWVGFAFGVGVALIVVLWIKDNIPNTLDIKWLSKLGGLFSKNTHVPARKFNAGQKFIYWSVAFGGLSLFATGLALLFPYEINLFAGTFKVMNIFGAGLATDLSPLHEMQLALLWHGIVAMIMILIMLGHIYIGSIGMEGAFDAMYSGKVDENWAKEHHSLWVEELSGGEKQSSVEPAE